MNLCQLIKILQDELKERTKGKYSSSWLIAQLQVIEESNRELPKWVKDLIKQYEKNKQLPKTKTKKRLMLKKNLSILKTTWKLLYLDHTAAEQKM